MYNWSQSKQTQIIGFMEFLEQIERHIESMCDQAASSTDVLLLQVRPLYYYF